MKYPCKNCTDRYPACHDHCEKYLAVKAEYDAYKAEQRRSRDASNYAFENALKNVDRDNKCRREG